MLPLERHVFVCENERAPSNPKGCCSRKGAAEVRDRLKRLAYEAGMKGRIRINSAGCLDQCAAGVTIVIYPEAVWYGNVTVEDVDELFREHVLGGRPVERLRLGPRQLRTPRRARLLRNHGMRAAALAATVAPWRRTRDPYAIWVSEIMLQQTQVATVIPYYLRFLERFPDVAKLATASEDEVLGLWSGLGYYRRARALAPRSAGGRGAARRTRAAPTRLRCAPLPGIGRYTAGAIASIAFGLPEPALDGNVHRVLARWSRNRRQEQAVGARRRTRTGNCTRRPGTRH